MHGNDFLLGWFLVRRSPRDAGRDARLPNYLLSASSCVCEVPRLADEPDFFAFYRQHGRNSSADCFYDSAESAREVNRRWFDGQFEVLALAMRPHAAARFDE